jgi:hypothetical protein
MSSLAAPQRGVLALIKNREIKERDAWINSIERSPQLEMLREIALWWRCFQLSAQCRFTTLLLRRMGCFEHTVASFFSGQGTSPYIEQLGRSFLVYVKNRSSGTIYMIAAIELAFDALRSMEIESPIQEIVCDRNPDEVFAALIQGNSLPEADPEFRYRLFVGRELPNGIQCVREKFASVEGVDSYD